MRRRRLWLLSRRVPASANPQPAEAHQDGTIQVQANHRCPPRCRQTDDDRAIIVLGEVRLPHLAGIED
ncbi:hypothetical protein [Candidatus Oscillochloris fontis]|uniref:hypothetical protein n=1 Tax=Candidatus Oscillochloris fontis TaxID=2496868 RepID=UPI00101C6B0D|nr:hypothetical protein [Candidatus Oscillochloris fontis]